MYVLSFQQDSGQQSGTGPLEYRVPVPKSTDCMVSLYGDKICVDQDIVWGVSNDGKFP